ncbi:hypothetical protein FBQ81_11225 [Chloroflexi bacterium CFX6]|nr:hypothetical protein [Chloroflexi bacterium CFX6]
MAKKFLRIKSFFHPSTNWTEKPSVTRYARMIEIAAGVPVKWIGVGPEMEATIRR